MAPRRSLTAPVLIAILAFALAAVACTGVAGPKGWASPSNGEGLLLVAHKDKLYALDEETLAPKWTFPSPQQKDDGLKPVAIYGTPAVAEGKVFVPGYDGTLFVLEADTGELDWQAPTSGPLIGGVTVADGTVYFGSDNGNVYAYDVASAQRTWEPFKAGGQGVWSTPVISGDTLYITSLDHLLYALDAATGAKRWSFKTDAGVAATPLVHDDSGLVYFGGFDSQLRAIDIATQEERWSTKAKNWFWSQPLLSDGVVYAGSLDGKVYAVDAASGESRWDKPFSTGAPIRSAPVVAGDGLFVVNKDGELYHIDPTTGQSNVPSLAIDGDVLSDPLVRTSDAGDQELVLVTTGGELVRVDPETLRVTSRTRLSG